MQRDLNLPELLPCAWCGGPAELNWDTDGSMYMEVFHHPNCPATLDSQSDSWCVWYYAEEFDPPESMPQQVADWWNDRCSRDREKSVEREEAEGKFPETAKLRSELDARYVPYDVDDGDMGFVKSTKWKFGGNGSAMFSEYDDGKTVFVTSGEPWTAERSFLATVGVGECENVYDEPQHFQCSECRIRGNIREVFDNGMRFSFCPDCGRKVK